MKKIITIVILIIIFAIGVYFGKNNSNKTDLSNDILEQNEIINQNNNIEKIRERGELKTSGLYNYNGDMSYENDLMQNDMTFHIECSLYHKVITNMGDYNKYKERIAIPEMTEKDFNNSFLVIIANENIRKDLKETNLMIYDIYCDETTTYITMKQKDETKLDVDQELLNNVFYAVVDNSQLKENINVEIEH